jgi:hypothetical protein
LQDVYDDIANAILTFYGRIVEIFQPLGLPFGRYAWMLITITGPLIFIILLLARRARRGGSALPEGVKRIIASTGDVSAGIAGTRKIPFIKSPHDALVFLKIEENATQQAITAVDYYVEQGEIEDTLKERYVDFYQTRLQAVQNAISSTAELREVIDSSTAVDKARSDYLRKLAAMSGTAVESDSSAAGPSSVGMPDLSPPESTTVSVSGPPSSAAPSGGPPGGAAPSGGPPSGGPPSGGPPGGAAPSGGPPSGAAPSGGLPDSAAPSGGPPSGAAPSAGPPSETPSPSGPPAGAAPSTGGGKSTLQSEMLAEMERLRALMSGD